MPGIAELYVEFANRHVAGQVTKGQSNRILRRDVDWAILTTLDASDLAPEYKFAWYDAIIHSKNFSIFWLSIKSTHKLSEAAIRPYIPDATLEEYEAPLFNLSPTASNVSSSPPATTPSVNITCSHMDAEDRENNELDTNRKRKRDSNMSDRRVSFPNPVMTVQPYEPLSPSPDTVFAAGADLPEEKNTGDTTYYATGGRKKQNKGSLKTKAAPRPRARAPKKVAATVVGTDVTSSPKGVLSVTKPKRTPRSKQTTSKGRGRTAAKTNIVAFEGASSMPLYPALAPQDYSALPAWFIGDPQGSKSYVGNFKSMDPAAVSIRGPREGETVGASGDGAGPTGGNGGS